MDIFIQASQFILSLSLLIILHEMGHFIPAKLFKTRVEKFYLFFDPWFSLVKKKIGGTEYGIGWLPLGGYVKISGMVDESMDKEQMKQEPKPWEFRSKPAWQRLIIMIGGVTVNVILAIVIYSGMMMYYGESYIVNDSVAYGVKVDSTAASIGLVDGDRIISVDGVKIERFSQIPLEILLSENGEIELERNGQITNITVTEDNLRELISARSQLVEPLLPFVVDSVVPESIASQMGIKSGDSVISLNGNRLGSFNEFVQTLPKYKEKEITLSLMRNGIEKNLVFKLPKAGKIGVSANTSFLETRYKKYGFFAAIPAGLNQSQKVLTDYIRQFRLIFNPKTEAYKELGGFIMIASQFDVTWNWQKFWGFTAFLSIMLAFLNILPIPALDGGHVVFVLWEMITGRKPSEKVLEYAQVVGFVILLGLIIVANGNDIIGLFNK